MFTGRYFAGRYFGNTYFPEHGSGFPDYLHGKVWSLPYLGGEVCVN